MTDAILDRLKAIRFELDERTRRSKMSQFVFNDFLIDFLADASRQKMIRGVNQIGGKTTGVCKLVTMVATGIAEPWFEHHPLHLNPEPKNIMVVGRNATQTRDVFVMKLLGPEDDRGSGLMPEEVVKKCRFRPVRSGVAGQLDDLYVPHISGRASRIKFCASSQRWDSFEGGGWDLIPFDEEPVVEVYNELQPRTWATGGYTVVSCVGTKGRTALQDLFEQEQGGKKLFWYTIDDCTHISEEQRQDVKDMNRDHPDEYARLYGGLKEDTGLIYPMEIQVIPDCPISPNFDEIIGIDIPHTSGYFACAHLGIDRGSGLVRVFAGFKDQAQPRAVYAERMIEMGGLDIPIAWPKDAHLSSDSGGSATIADAYRKFKLKMLREFSHYEDSYGHKDNTKSTVIHDMWNRLKTGTIEFCETPAAIFNKEKLRYRQEDGKPIRRQDDHFIDACHCALRSIRHARPRGGRIKEAWAHSGHQQQVDFFSKGRKGQRWD